MDFGLISHRVNLRFEVMYMNIGALLNLQLF